MKKICLMITGQMRTYKKCFANILDNLIKYNNEYKFDIYIFTEYHGINGGTIKNNFKNEETTLEEFKKSIESVYGDYLKFLRIENNDIDYPPYLDNYGPWMCLYRNKVLFQSIKDHYDVFVRLRPDIHLTNKLNIDLLKKLDDTIYIITGAQKRHDSWLHNRDWDHMCMSNKIGMKLWCDYYQFLEINPPVLFNNEIRFNNQGYWIKEEKNDKSVITTQLFFEYIITNNFKLEFDSGKCFSLPIR